MYLKKDMHRVQVLVLETVATDALGRKLVSDRKGKNGIKGRDHLQETG